MTHYLTSYRPLAKTAQGRSLATKFSIPAFIDGSCRREPDLQSVYPSISALCRGSKFAPRLRKDDEIAYITVKSSFGENLGSHRKFVAHLRVLEEFSNHEAAAAWYRNKDLIPPSNCMFLGSLPMPYELTSGRSDLKWRTYSDLQKLKFWDGTYRKRAHHIGNFLVCESLFLALVNPPRLFDEDFISVFSRVPGTQNPPQINPGQIESLLQYALARERRSISVN